MRDSSLDYRTYWLQGGQYYSRRALGDAVPACTLPMDKLRQIPEADRKVLLEEVNADPSFCKVIANCMATKPDWAHRISARAKEAIVNEMDPSKFRGSTGTWPKLRERVRTIVEEVSRMAGRGKVAVGAKSLSGLEGLGQWDIIASLVGSIGSAAASVYGANLTARAQQNIAQTQAEAAMAQAQAQIAMSNAANALQSANATINPISSAVTALTTATVAGIPLLALAIPAVGLIIYFATKK